MCSKTVFLYSECCSPTFSCGNWLFLDLRYFVVVVLWFDYEDALPHVMTFSFIMPLCCHRDTFKCLLCWSVAHPLHTRIKETVTWTSEFTYVQPGEAYKLIKWLSSWAIQISLISYPHHSNQDSWYMWQSNLITLSRVTLKAHYNSIAEFIAGDMKEHIPVCYNVPWPTIL